MTAHDTCDHPLDLHAVIATNGNPLNGGIVLCPVHGCPCFSTFGVQGQDVEPVVPSEEAISRFRTAVQTGEM